MLDKYYYVVYNIDILNEVTAMIVYWNGTFRTLDSVRLEMALVAMATMPARIRV